MSKRPRYQEIAADLRRRLTAGEFPVGSKLPGISELQEQYEVPGLNTVRQAQALLIEEGLIEAVQGSGTFVRALPSSDQPTDLRESLVELQGHLSAAQTIIGRVLRQLDDANPD